LWNEKAELLRQGMEMNPFNSTHFYWVDIGCIRKIADIFDSVKDEECD
jgi:hypothetical protein